MKKKYYFVLLIFILFILLFVFLKIKTKISTSFYLWEPENTNVYSEKNSINNIFLPFRGKIKGALFIRGEEAVLTINGEKYNLNGNFLFYFPEEKKISINLAKGKVFIFNSLKFKPKTFSSDKKLKFKDKRFLRILTEIKPNFFNVKEIITNSITFPEKSKIIIQDILSEKDWIKNHEFLRKYYYIKVDKTAYQAKYVAPDSEIILRRKIKGGMNLSFYAGSVNFLTKTDFFNNIGDGNYFSISILKGKKTKKIFEKKILNSVRFFNIKIPENCDGLVFRTSRGKNSFGDICFWGSPYLYKPSIKKKVFILISLDTVRAKSLSLYNPNSKASPFLKKWGTSDCLYYTRAYTTYPWTTEAHRSVFFSTYSWDERKLSIAEFLQKKGFYTFALTGGNLVSSGLGFARGFTSYLDDNFNLFNRDAARILFNRAKTLITMNKGKDLFIFLHTYQAHSPYMPPVEYSILGEKGVVDMFSLTKGVRGTFSPLPERIRKKAETLYEEEILAIDQDFIRPLVKFLKQKQIYSKTSILIFGDHGEQFFEHGSWEHGYSLYDEEIRVPLIIKADNVKKGRDNHLMSLKKIPILISRILGFEPYKKWESKGKDFIIFSTSPEYSLLSFPFKMGILKDDFKLIYNIKIDKRKFENPPTLPKYELYDLAKDPEEKDNLVFKNRKIYKELKRILNFYYKKAASQRRKNLEKIKRNLKSLGYVD